MKLAAFFTTTLLATAPGGFAIAANDALSAFFEELMSERPAPECRTYQTTDGTKQACHWAYPYRSEAAYDGFDAKVAHITERFPDLKERSRPDGVNHPDTHDVRVFVIEGRTITISLKDKSQLGQSLVFIINDESAKP